MLKIASSQIYKFCKMWKLYYSWFHENGSFDVHSFSENYLFTPEYTDSRGNRFQETNVTEHATCKMVKVWKMHKLLLKRRLSFFKNQSDPLLYKGRRRLFIFFVFFNKTNLLNIQALQPVPFLLIYTLINGEELWNGLYVSSIFVEVDKN